MPDPRQSLNGYIKRREGRLRTNDDKLSAPDGREFGLAVKRDVPQRVNLLAPFQAVRLLHAEQLNHSDVVVDGRLGYA